MLAKLSPVIDWFKYLKRFLISCREEVLVDCSNTALQFLGHSSCLLCLQLPGDLINLRVWFWPQVKDKNMSGNNPKNILFANLTPCSRDQCKAFHWPGLRFLGTKKMVYKYIPSHVASTNKHVWAHVRARRTFYLTCQSFCLHVLLLLPPLLLYTHITFSHWFLKKGFFASLAVIQYSGIFYRSNKAAYFVDGCPAAEIGKYNIFCFLSDLEHHVGLEGFPFQVYSTSVF